MELYHNSDPLEEVNSCRRMVDTLDRLPVAEKNFQLPINLTVFLQSIYSSLIFIRYGSLRY